MFMRDAMRNIKTVLYALIFGLFAINMFNVAGATGFTIPNSIVHYSNISISNAQSGATANGLQVMISFNALAYQSYETNSLNNIEFFYTGNGTVVPSWMEGNQLDWYQPANTLYTSSNVIFWIKYAPSIAAHSTAVNTIAVGFATKTSDLLNNINTGEAPQLSCSNPANTVLCDYGEYDDGSKIFNYYWNFSHANSWHDGGPGYGPAGIEYADNGMRVQGWTFDNVQGIPTDGNVITVLVNTTGYSSAGWVGTLSLSNSSSGTGFGTFPGVGTIAGAYTYSPLINLYQGLYFTHLQLGSNVTDLKSPHTISIGFNGTGGINYTSINYESSMGSETSNMLALFPQGAYNQGPLVTGMLACTNLTVASAGAKLTTSSIKCTGTFDNKGLVYGGNGGADSCTGGSGAGSNGISCSGNPSSFAGSGGAGGGNSSTGLIGGNGGSTRVAGGSGTTGTGGSGGTPSAPAVVDAANVAVWDSAPLAYLGGSGGGGGANGGSGGGAASQGMFLEAGKVIAGNVNESPYYHAGSGGGGGGAGALLIAYGNGGYTAGTYAFAGGTGGAAGSGWAAGGSGGSGQLITYDYGANAMPVGVSFPKQSVAYPILSTMTGNASFYYMYSGYMPPMGKMPSASFGGVRLTPLCTVFITNPSNSILDVGQYETFTVSEDNCTSPYTYNILVSNSISPSTITHNDLITGSSANSVTYTFQTVSADLSDSPEVANVVLSSGSGTVFSSYSQPFRVNPTLSFGSLTSSPALPSTEDTGNAVSFTASVSGGSSPYTYNFLISNITTGRIVGNYLAHSSSASDTVSWQIPYSVGNNALEVNVIVSDGSAAGAETVNSAYIKPLYTKSVISVTNVFPNSCISQGGCIVEVDGTGFFNGTTVDFGSASASSVNIVNQSSMRVTVPAGTAGSNVSVSVHNPFGAESNWSSTFQYGNVFISDNFSGGNFAGWNETGACCATGDFLQIVTGGQLTYDNTITPNPIYGTNEAMIWYPFRQGSADINGTKMTLVSGDPFDSNWRNTDMYLGGFYGIVTNNGSTVNWLSGDKFITNGSWTDQNITIFEQSRKIVSVTNSTQLILNASPGGNTGYFDADKWWEGFSHKIVSCSSSTSCTLSQNLGVQNNVHYIQGTDDINNFFGQSFQSNRPTNIFIRGYVYFQAPTHGGPFGQRKIFYIKQACGGSTGLPCVGIAFIFDSFYSSPYYGNVSINGTSVNWVSGHQFPTDGSWNGKGILIDGGKNYTVASVTNATHLTLTSSAGVQTDAAYASLANGVALTSAVQSEIVNGAFTDPAQQYMDHQYLNFNQWYEVQVEAVLNTPGVANGYYNVWINGQYRPDLSKYGIEWRNASNDQGWQYVEVGRQLDAGNAASTYRIAWENEYRFWDAVALSNAYLPSPVQLQQLNITLTTATTTTVTTSTSTTTTAGTTSTTTAPVTTVSGSGSGTGNGGGAGSGTGGGGGSSKPTVSSYSTSSAHGWEIVNFTQDNSENVDINGRLFGITLNSISPRSADVTVNGETYALDVGTPVSIGSGYSLNLSNVYYLPIIDTVTLEIYANVSLTSSASNSSSSQYNVSVDLNGSSFALGTSRYITAYANSSSDTVAIYTNGVLQAEGNGLASFNIDALAKGNYTLQACDISVSPRVCSSTEKFSILAPATTVTTTVPALTTIGQHVSSSPFTAEDYLMVVVAVIAIAVVIAAMLHYRNRTDGRKGDKEEGKGEEDAGGNGRDITDGSSTTATQPPEDSNVVQPSGDDGIEYI